MTNIFDAVRDAYHDWLNLVEDGALSPEAALDDENSVASILQALPSFGAELADDLGMTSGDVTQIKRDAEMLLRDPTLRQVGTWAVALISAGIASGEHEKALQEYLESNRATFEDRQNAILGAAAKAVADERARQEKVDKIVAILEGAGTATLTAIGYVTLKFLGLPTDFTGD